MSTPNERELVEFGERLSRYRKIAPRPEFRAVTTAGFAVACPVTVSTALVTAVRTSSFVAATPVLTAAATTTVAAAAPLSVLRTESAFPTIICSGPSFLLCLFQAYRLGGRNR